MKRLFCLLTLAAILMALATAAALAQEPTYDEVKASLAVRPLPIGRRLATRRSPSA